MKLIALSLTNYRQHKWSAIRFEDGITGILGANGAGKSSILEAIAYALYGPHAAKREGRAEAILWQRAPGKSDVEVVLAFELLGETYTIERRLKQARLFKGEGTDGSLIRSGPGEVTQYVEDNLGMDRETFFNSFFARQKELAFLASVKGAKRQELITRMLGLEQVDRARQLVSEERRTLKTRLEGKRAGLGDPAGIQAQVEVAKLALQQAKAELAAAESVHAATRSALETWRPQFEAGNQQAAAHQTLQSKQEALTREAELLQAEHERLAQEQQRLEAARPRWQALEAPLARLADARREWTEQEALRGSEEKRQALLGQRQAHEAAAQARRAALTQLQGELAALGPNPADLLQALAPQLAQAETAVSQAERAHAAHKQELATQLEQAREQYRKLQDKKKHLATGDHQNCPTCLRPLGSDDLTTVVAEFDQQLSELAMAGKRLKEQSDRLSGEPETLREARRARAALGERQETLRQELNRHQGLVQREREAQNELQKLVAALAELDRALAELPAGYQAERFERLAQEVRELQPLEVEAGQLQAGLARLPELAVRLQEQGARLAEVRTALADAAARLAELNYQPEQHQMVTVQFQMAEKAEREAGDQFIKAQQGVGAAEQLVAVYERQWQALSERLAEVADEEKELAYLELLEERFKAFRDRLNSDIRPQLSDLASIYLAQLTDGRYTALEIDDHYDVRVFDDGEAFPLERFSGGEQDVVNLCLRLAISQMITDRAGQPLSFIVLDEVFGSLDESRRENVIGLLEALGHRFQQVILISHLEEIKQALHQVVRVGYDERAGHSWVALEEAVEEAGVPLGLPI